MNNSPPEADKSPWHIRLFNIRWLRTDLRHTALRLSSLVLGFLLLVVLLTAWQGRTDETRAVDAIVVFLSSANTDVLLDRAIDLYRRRYSRRMLVVTSDPATVQADLIARGIPDTALLMVEDDADNWRSIYSVAETARQHMVQSILIIDNPDALLLHLKVAHDLGLSAYGSRSRTLSVHFGRLLQASVHYWHYILIGPGVRVQDPVS